MDVILCHVAADFDTVGAAVGAAHLYAGARIVLTGGSHPTVAEFLALHRNAYPLLDLRALDPAQVRRWILVDCHEPARLGKAGAWLQEFAAPVHVYDHHLGEGGELEQQAELWCIEPVGSTCTLIVERLQRTSAPLPHSDLLALALGIHVDTGSLRYPASTARDAQALAWLMEQGVAAGALGRYLDNGLSPAMQDLLCQGLSQMQMEAVEGVQLAGLVLRLPEFRPGLAGLAMRLLELTEADVLIMAAQQGERISLIGRARQDFAQLQTVMAAYGGGGHALAASATVKGQDPDLLVRQALAEVRGRIPRPPLARQLMSAPVRTIRPDTLISEAQRLLLRYGHSGLAVADAQARLVGVISRRDIDIALHHGFGHAPVRAYMTTAVRTIQPDTPLPEIQTLMVKWDIGRLPVLEEGRLVGIVTRTDVLRHLQELPQPAPAGQSDGRSLSLPWVEVLTEGQQRILSQVAQAAEDLKVNVYLVGGAVRDLLLGRATQDLDLVVDGPYPLQPDGASAEGWGVRLGRALHRQWPETRLEVHGRFQTVALTWPGGAMIDIATARTEFYPYPAALPEIDLGSIQQDLYRRDFSINALALRLNGPQAGQVLDFFGGWEDLKRGRIRVLHANSFIEDPTRIFRAVRFAVRLGFGLDPETEGYLRSAVASGLHDAVGGDRLKQELHYILKERHWPEAFAQLAEWGALRCIHPDLIWDPALRARLRRAGAWGCRFGPPELPKQALWQLRLEALLLGLSGAAEVAERLHLTHQRLGRFREQAQPILPQLAPGIRPSQVVQQLQGLSLAEVILLATIAEREARRLLWCYLSHWRRQKPMLSGHDLRQMGYPVGPLFQQILEQVRWATLDGILSTPEAARAFVQSRFPLAKRSI